MGQAVHIWGQGIHGESLSLPLDFPVNLKLSKNKANLKEKKIIVKAV